LTRSDGNSRPPLEGFTLFLERPLGKKVAAALRALGISVVGHSEVLAETADDAEYLGLCAERDWVPLTADSDVHTNPAQRALIKRSRLRVFRLTRNHWPWQEKLEAFVAALPAMDALLRAQPGPFIARINRAGKISSVEDLRDPSPKR
jgi:hypothetical protein